jgi:tryptophan-rich sensory protein
MNKWIKLIASVLICLAAGLIGSIFTTPSIPTWYASLSKPSFAPPNWVFGPVWTTLYILMGISLYLILNKGLKNVRMQVIVFGIQLVLNAVWSFLFFGLQSLLYGLVGIILLWISIVITIFSFFKVSRKASFLLIPYIAWVSFATIANYYLLILN